MRVHLDHGSTLQCQIVNLDRRCALGCKSVHWDDRSALGSWECIAMRESAKGCIEGTAVMRVSMVHKSALGSW